jgi:hypothetical protein
VRLALAAAVLLLLATTPAAAEPTVTTSAEHGTTEPSPTAPILRARKAPRGAARIRVVGDGALCGATWTVAARDRRVELTAAPAAGISFYGTCALTVTIRGLARGRHVIALDGRRVTVKVR